MARTDSGTLYLDVTTKSADHEALAAELRKVFEKASVLGLTVKPGVPAKPSGPSLACQIALTDAGEAVVQVSTTSGLGRDWVSSGKFSLPLEREKVSGDLKPALLADAMAEGVLARLVRAQLTKGPKVKGKETFKIRIDNVSPLVLNGLALAGTTPTPEARPSAVAGFSLPPHKSLTVPATEEMVERLGLKDGVRAIAADLSGL